MIKKKWFGSMLNFLLPGLGNIYSRKIKKGILTYILFLIIVLSLRFVTFNFVLFLGSLSSIIAYYLYLVFDGYRDVKKNHVYEPAEFDKGYVYILIIVFHWTLAVFIGELTRKNITPINFATIPTPAMDPSLQVGDRLAFKKTKAIERNDVTVFWFPDDIKTMYVKRCIGLPGDSLRIRNSKVIINGIPIPERPFRFKYEITTDGSEINHRILEKYHIGDNDFYRGMGDSYHFFLTEQQAKEFSELPFVKKAELSVAEEGEAGSMIYPVSENVNWNVDFYGPIYIPKRGDTISLTDENIDLYMKCIEFENESVEKSNAGLNVNGQQMSAYTFKDNYFFMMGDNRHNSLDSRYWGFLPEKLVIGKAMYIYWGSTSGRIGKDVI